MWRILCKESHRYDWVNQRLLINQHYDSQLTCGWASSDRQGYAHMHFLLTKLWKSEKGDVQFYWSEKMLCIGHRFYDLFQLLLPPKLQVSKWVCSLQQCHLKALEITKEVYEQASQDSCEERWADWEACVICIRKHNFNALQLLAKVHCGHLIHIKTKNRHQLAWAIEWELL